MSARSSAVVTIPRSKDALRCTGCEQRVCEQLQTLDGVARVECAAADGSVRVEYDPDVFDEAALFAEAERMGTHVAHRYGHAAWRVSGLD